MKKCFSCKAILPFNAFGLRTDRKTTSLDCPSKYSSSCLECNSLNAKLRFFKISKEDFFNLKVKYDNKCGICGIAEKDTYTKKTKHYGLYIDHCHVNNNVRGLLCHSCNLVLGHAKDNINLLQKAINYLKREDIVYSA